MNLRKLVADALLHQIDPVFGHYQMRLARRGPFVPVRIYEGQRDEAGELIEDEWQCQINGERADVFRAWPWCEKHPIDAAEHELMLRHAEWDRLYGGRDAPANQPKEPVDWDTLPPRF